MKYIAKTTLQRHVGVDVPGDVVCVVADGRPEAVPQAVRLWNETQQRFICGHSHTHARDAIRHLASLEGAASTCVSCARLGVLKKKDKSPSSEVGATEGGFQSDRKYETAVARGLRDRFSRNPGPENIEAVVQGKSITPPQTGSFFVYYGVGHDLSDDGVNPRFVHVHGNGKEALFFTGRGVYYALRGIGDNDEKANRISGPIKRFLDQDNGSLKLPQPHGVHSCGHYILVARENHSNNEIYLRVSRLERLNDLQYLTPPLERIDGDDSVKVQVEGTSIIAALLLPTLGRPGVPATVLLARKKLPSHAGPSILAYDVRVEESTNEKITLLPSKVSKKSLPEGVPLHATTCSYTFHEVNEKKYSKPPPMDGAFFSFYDDKKETVSFYRATSSLGLVWSGPFAVIKGCKLEQTGRQKDVYDALSGIRFKRGTATITLSTKFFVIPSLGSSPSKPIPEFVLFDISGSVMWLVGSTDPDDKPVTSFFKSAVSMVKPGGSGHSAKAVQEDFPQYSDNNAVGSVASMLAYSAYAIAENSPILPSVVRADKDFDWKLPAAGYQMCDAVQGVSACLDILGMGGVIGLRLAVWTRLGVVRLLRFSNDTFGRGAEGDAYLMFPPVNIYEDLRNPERIQVLSQRKPAPIVAVYSGMAMCAYFPSGSLSGKPPEAHGVRIIGKLAVSPTVKGIEAWSSEYTPLNGTTMYVVCSMAAFLPPVRQVPLTEAEDDPDTAQAYAKALAPGVFTTYATYAGLKDASLALTMLARGWVKDDADEPTTRYALTPPYTWKMTDASPVVPTGNLENLAFVAETFYLKDTLNVSSQRLLTALKKHGDASVLAALHSPRVSQLACRFIILEQSLSGWPNWWVPMDTDFWNAPWKATADTVVFNAPVTTGGRQPPTLAPAVCVAQPSSSSLGRNLAARLKAIGAPVMVNFDFDRTLFKASSKMPESWGPQPAGGESKNRGLPYLGVNGRDYPPAHADLQKNPAQFIDRVDDFMGFLGELYGGGDTHRVFVAINTFRTDAFLVQRSSGDGSETELLPEKATGALIELLRSGDSPSGLLGAMEVRAMSFPAATIKELEPTMNRATTTTVKQTKGNPNVPPLYVISSEFRDGPDLKLKCSLLVYAQAFASRWGMAGDAAAMSRRRSAPYGAVVLLDDEPDNINAFATAVPPPSAYDAGVTQLDAFLQVPVSVAVRVSPNGAWLDALQLAVTRLEGLYGISPTGQ